jgi:hypothetical protein
MFQERPGHHAFALIAALINQSLSFPGSNGTGEPVGVTVKGLQSAPLKVKNQNELPQVEYHKSLLNS